ncbi:MAG: PEP-CTERM sorting domain-containing protein [Hydrococcus sp. CSU_1_8]|nr:PEP-CTERM sorting domain-containing protein [Hydrococcus sp. CSU_1_8]
MNNVDVSILGAGFSQSFDLQADARLQVIYTYQDAPPRSIPEPGTFVGLLAFAGLGLAANRRRAS